MKRAISQLQTLAIVIVGISSWTGGAAATTLASHTSSQTFSSQPGDPLSLAIWYGDGLPDLPTSTAYLPFSSVDLSTVSAGSSFTATAATSTDFSGAAGVLTNGTSDFIGTIVCTPVCISDTTGGEAGLLSGPGFTNPDLQGHLLQSMTLTITSFSQIPLGAGLLSSLAYRVDYEGLLVPEPSTGLLVFMGLAGISLLHRARSHRTARWMDG